MSFLRALFGRPKTDYSDEESLLSLEKSISKDELEYISPWVVIELINEIKSLRGWEINPHPFDDDKEIKPVGFDFSEIEDED